MSQRSCLLRNLYDEIVGCVIVVAMRIGDSFFTRILYSIVVVAVVVIGIVVVVRVIGVAHGATAPR